MVDAVKPILLPAVSFYTWAALAAYTWDELAGMTWGDLSQSGSIGTDNGLGVLTDAASCIVTEERNGSYELELKYPLDGLHYKDIDYRSVILAKPSPQRERQPFRVYRITRPLGGMVTVYARHISYDLSGVVVAPFAASTLAEALEALRTNALPDNHGFTFWTNKGGAGGMAVAAPSSLRSVLGGVDGSILDTYGGEYEFDGFTVKLWDARGEDRGVTLRYGKNLTSLEQESNCANVYTAVYPYWTDGETTVTLEGKTVPVPGTFAYEKILPVDLSSTFEAAPSQDDLRTAAQYYITDNKVGVPTVSLQVSFAQLGGETLELCDTVEVRFERLGVSARAKVVKTVYNVLLDRYDTVEIGDTRSSIADTIAGQTADIREAATSLDLQRAVVNATGWITGSKGGYVIFKRNAEGQPTEILIMDSPDTATAKKVWRWNTGGLGYSGSGVNGPYSTAITQDGSIVGSFVTADGLFVNAANINGTLTASQIDADDLHVNAANINGTLAASQIDATNLHVKAANVDGTITADAINLNTAQITGTLSANYIDVDSLTVKNANIESLYADKIIGGNIGGYVSANAISGQSHLLSSLFVNSFYANNAVNIMSNGDADSGIVIDQAGITQAGTRHYWSDIFSASASAVFG